MNGARIRNRHPMPKTLTGIPYTLIPLDLQSLVPLYRQLYKALRHLILTGDLLAGTQLPATRTLANELKLSRNTVVNAIDQLIAEGYLETHVRSGTYVSSSLPIEMLDVNHHKKTHVLPTI